MTDCPMYADSTGVCSETQQPEVSSTGYCWNNVTRTQSHLPPQVRKVIIAPVCYINRPLDPNMNWQSMLHRWIWMHLHRGTLLHICALAQPSWSSYLQGWICESIM
jgi:hypothetical protein